MNREHHFIRFSSSASNTRLLSSLDYSTVLFGSCSSSSMRSREKMCALSQCQIWMSNQQRNEIEKECRGQKRNFDSHFNFTPEFHFGSYKLSLSLSLSSLSLSFLSLSNGTNLVCLPLRLFLALCDISFSFFQIFKWNQTNGLSVIIEPKGTTKGWYLPSCLLLLVFFFFFFFFWREDRSDHTSNESELQCSRNPRVKEKGAWKGGLKRKEKKGLCLPCFSYSILSLPAT